MTRPNTFYRIRIAVLSFVLLCILVFAWRDYSARKSRTNWTRPLDVGIVVVQLDVRGQSVSPTALNELLSRTRALGKRLSAEFARHTGQSRLAPFETVPYGPLLVEEAPPEPRGNSWWQQARHAFELWRYVSNVDATLDVPSRGLDSRIYVVVEPVMNQELKLVEGFSQQGGHLGVARVQLDESTVDLALFVAAHELFHTLGASDKYDSRGRALVPEGLAAPERDPLYPQPGAEVMARNRVLSETEEAVPETLTELWVGRWTAVELGWPLLDTPQGGGRQ